jgi:hypothetical protein
MGSAHLTNHAVTQIRAPSPARGGIELAPRQVPLELSHSALAFVETAKIQILAVYIGKRANTFGANFRTRHVVAEICLYRNLPVSKVYPACIQVLASLQVEQIVDGLCSRCLCVLS